MSLNFSSKAEDAVKKCVNPRTKPRVAARRWATNRRTAEWKLLQRPKEAPSGPCPRRTGLKSLPQRPSGQPQVLNRTLGRRCLFSAIMSTACKTDQAFPLREVIPECDRMGDLCCHCPWYGPRINGRFESRRNSPGFPPYVPNPPQEGMSAGTCTSVCTTYHYLIQGTAGLLLEDTRQLWGPNSLFLIPYFPTKLVLFPQTQIYGKHIRTKNKNPNYFLCNLLVFYSYQQSWYSSFPMKNLKYMAAKLQRLGLGATEEIKEFSFHPLHLVSFPISLVGGGLIIQLCLTLGSPWTVTPQAPLSTGFPKQEYRSGLPTPSPGDLPDPGIEPTSPALQAGSLLNELPSYSWGDLPQLSVTTVIRGGKDNMEN